MIDKLCIDLKKIFMTTVKSYDIRLIKKVHELAQYLYAHKLALKDIEPLIELKREVAAQNRPNKQLLEREILRIFESIAWTCESDADSKKYVTLNKELIASTQDHKLRKRYGIALRLVSVALEAYHFKQARDTFSIERKVMALDLLSTLSEFYHIPEVPELCLLAMTSKKGRVIFSALGLLSIHYQNLDIPLPNHIQESLDTLIETTDYRDIVVGALQVQVENGLISELEALSILDDWTDEHNSY